MLSVTHAHTYSSMYKRLCAHKTGMCIPTLAETSVLIITQGHVSFYMHISVSVYMHMRQACAYPCLRHKCSYNHTRTCQCPYAHAYVASIECDGLAIKICVFCSLNLTVSLKDYVFFFTLGYITCSSSFLIS